MKYSVAAVSAFAAAALAKPAFTNLSFEVEVGKPFTLTFTGCSAGCDIELQTGASNNLKDVKAVATGATGTSATVTLDKIPSGTYNFKITDSNGDSNYSAQFPVQGDVIASASSASETSVKETNTATAAPTSTTAASSAEASTTLVKSTTAHSTAASNTTTAAPTTSHSASAKHNSTSSALSTGHATTTTAAQTTAAKTSSKPAITTVPPGSAAGRLASPIALVAGVALAIAFLS
ncbi:hypothetical protein ACQKWADRAFT_288571 [Trichoderma austrokoningii]